MNMKQLRCVAGVLAGIFIFGEIVRGLNYLYVPENNADAMWYRIMWNSFYEEQGNIDNVVLGSSHVFCDINPYLLDERNHQCNFNLSSPGQLMNATYYLLKEADKNNELSHVYIELFYLNNIKATFGGEEPITEKYFNNWGNVDHMKMSLNKLAYMLTMTDVEKYPETWVQFIRYRTNLSDWGGIADTVNWKKSEDYLNYNYQFFYRETDECETVYGKKGYYYTPSVFNETGRFFFQSTILQENPMAELSEQYLRKTIAFCQRKNIPVTLFVSPMYDLQLISTENYDNYVNQVRGIAEEYHVEFYDFNLVGEEYLPIQHPKYFMDGGHLNSVGADLFTDFFNQVMSGDIDVNKKYFYDSYKERLQNQEPEVYGIYYRDSKDSEDDGDLVRHMWIGSNRETEMEYRIIFMPYGKGQELIQDFSVNKEFKIESSSESGTLSVEYRLKTNPSFIQKIEIEIEL